MHYDPPKQLTITFTGTLSVGVVELEQMLRQAYASRPVEEGQAPGHLKIENHSTRLAFSMREAAELLGVSYITMHRLIQRGLIRASGALRHKVIPKSELDRFLRNTL